MPDLTITKFSKDLQARLNRRAARTGRSAEAEAREILREAVKYEPKAVRPKAVKGKLKAANGKLKRVPDNLYDSIRAIVEPHGGYVLDIPSRHPEREHEPRSSNSGK